jgi:hypothetical protein
VLSAALHDWDDEDAVRILQRCADAASETGKVLVVDHIGDAQGEVSNDLIGLRPPHVDHPVRSPLQPDANRPKSGRRRDCDDDRALQGQPDAGREAESGGERPTGNSDGKPEKAEAG